MGFRFRKRIKIAPGVYINLSKSGVSTSVGGSGATVNIGKNGVKGTVGVPGTGLSYTENFSASPDATENEKAARPESTPSIRPEDVQWSGDGVRPVSNLLAIGIFFVPIIFAWYLLRPGYSNRAKVLGFGWLIVATAIGVLR